MSMTRVLIVDDSALMRKVLCSILEREAGIEVVGTAGDAFVAREKIRRLNPDVLTLDVAMPGMDGLTFLKNLMRLRPMPVVMVSTLTESGAEVTFEALEAGAVDFVTKPRFEQRVGLEGQAETIISKVKAAARARLRVGLRTCKPISPKHSTDAILPRRPPSGACGAERIVAIGASTGGTEAIKEVLIPLGADAPTIVIAQHIPPAFSASFARRLNELCKIEVTEAENGAPLLPGHAYVAPGDSHLIVERSGATYVSRLSGGPAVNRHRPSVDVLFRSTAGSAGANGVGIILTGMGADGAKGLLEMRQAGAHTIAQDELTSVVWGMPKEAIRIDGACEVLPLEQVSARLMAAVLLRQRSTA